MEIMVVTEERGGFDLPGKGTVRDVLEKLDINLETVLVRVNGSIESEEHELKEGDEVEIIRVISGG